MIGTEAAAVGVHSDKLGSSQEVENSSKTDQIIPLLCMVDVFLSSHFSPFRGHFFIPSLQSEQLKKCQRDSESKKEGEDNEECIAFHSVFSDEGEGDLDKGIDFPHRLPLLRGVSFSGRAASPSNIKIIGSGSQQGDRKGINDTSMQTGVADAEGSYPTYIDLCTNTVITNINCCDYITKISAETTRKNEKTSLEMRANADAVVQDLSWRVAHPSNLHNREMLLTIDKGNILKVWSARRMELSIPVTTATRSISGAGTSCIVSGNFHAHINPEVSLLLGTSLQQLVQDTSVIEYGSSAASCNRYLGAVRVSWMNHLLCSSSEQEYWLQNTAHSLNQDVTNALEGSASSREMNGATATSISNSSDVRKVKSERAFGSTAQRVNPQDFSHSETGSTFNHGSASGIWLAVLAPYHLLNDPINVRNSGDDRNIDIDAIDSDENNGQIRSQSMIRNKSVSTQRTEHFQYSFVCLNSHPHSNQTQAVVRGRGPIISVGSALFVPNTPIKLGEKSNCFAAVSKFFVSGRFASDGSGHPFSIDIVTALKDAKCDNLEGRCDDKRYMRMIGSYLRKGRAESCLVKVISCINKHVGEMKNLPATGLHRPVPTEGLRSGAGFFTLPALTYDLLYLGTASESNEARFVEDMSQNCAVTLNDNTDDCRGTKNTENSRERISLQYVLPFSADSLAGTSQACLSAFDAYGQVFRVCSDTSNAFPIPCRNIETDVKPYHDLSEQQRAQPEHLDSISQNILPSPLKAVGLIDLNASNRYGAEKKGVKGCSSDSEYSVVRAMVVPSDSLRLADDDVSGNSNDLSCSSEADQLLLILQHSLQYGLKIVIWSKTPSNKNSKGDEEDNGIDRSSALDSTPFDPLDSTNVRVPPVQDIPANDVPRGPFESRTDVYVAEVVPDPLYGLGLRLDIRDGAIIGEKHNCLHRYLCQFNLLSLVFLITSPGHRPHRIHIQISQWTASSDTLSMIIL